eukprot:bmy_15080T0
MDAFISFTNQTQGRDQLFRATKYTCMLLRYLLEPKADKEEVVKKLKKLESSVSTGCKWFRLGNVVHVVQATQQSIHVTDLVPRVYLTLASLNLVIYFICDPIIFKHLPLLLDTVKNFCDILNPLDQLGIYKSNPGIIGLGGLVSSMAGIITVAYPQMKLKTH